MTIYNGVDLLILNSTQFGAVLHSNQSASSFILLSKFEADAVMMYIAKTINPPLKQLSLQKGKCWLCLQQEHRI